MACFRKICPVPFKILSFINFFFSRKEWLRWRLYRWLNWRGLLLWLWWHCFSLLDINANISAFFEVIHSRIVKIFRVFGYFTLGSFTGGWIWLPVEFFIWDLEKIKKLFLFDLFRGELREDVVDD